MRWLAGADGALFAGAMVSVIALMTQHTYRAGFSASAKYYGWAASICFIGWAAIFFGMIAKP